MGSFQEKTIVITGAAMGLGLAAAKELATRGANLVLVDYNPESLARAQEEVAALMPGSRLVTVVADVSQETAVRHYVEEAEKAFGRIDGLYNNAGIEGKPASMVDYDLEAFKQVIDINLMGVYYGLRYVLPRMQRQQYGRIVNVASVGGIRGLRHQTPYIASKHAVVGMTKNAALEYARYGIAINAIAPGGILTPMLMASFRQASPDNPEQAIAEAAKSNPTQRMGTPEEVAKLAAFLLSADASYVNGQTIAIDGGESNIFGPV